MDKLNKTIFAITYDGNIKNSKFYYNITSARVGLKQIKDDRKNKLGVTVIVDEMDKFSFILGWEGHETSFNIVEIYIEA